MCNLYAMTPKQDDLGRFFRVSHNRMAAFRPVNAIFPRHVAPVVRDAEDGEREIILVSWGFLRLEKGRAPSLSPMSATTRSKPIRSGATASPSGAASCRHPRSDGEVKPATWNWFAVKGQGERPLFA